MNFYKCLGSWHKGKGSCHRCKLGYNSKKDIFFTEIPTDGLRIIGKLVIKLNI